MRPGAVLLAAGLTLAATTFVDAANPPSEDGSSVRPAIEALQRMRDWQVGIDLKVGVELHTRPTASEFSIQAVGASRQSLHRILAQPERHPQLQTLDLSRSAVTDADMDALAKFNTLETLLLTQTAVTDDGLERLKALPRVSILYLNSTNITDAGLVHLTKMPLVELHLFGTQVTAAGLESISAIKSLRVLSIANTRIKFSEFETAGPKGIKCVYLDTLQLRSFMPEKYYGTVFQPAVWYPLVRNGFVADVCYAPNDQPPIDQLYFAMQLPRETNRAFVVNAWLPAPRAEVAAQPTVVEAAPSVQFTRPRPILHRLTNSQRIALERASYLELDALKQWAGDIVDLELTRTDCLYDIFNHDRTYAHLQSLNLAESRLNPGTLAGLLAPKLRSLKLNGATNADVEIRAIDSQLLGKLDELELALTRLTDAGVARLQLCERLKILNLAETTTSDFGLAQIRTLKNLESLNLEFTRVTDEGIAALAQMENLQTLNLAGTGVTDAGLRVLVGCRSLRTLDVRETQVTALGTSRLQLKLPQLEVLE